MDAASEAALLSKGLKALPSDLGLDALRAALLGGEGQRLVMFRDINRPLNLTGQASEDDVATAQQAAEAAPQIELSDEAIEQLHKATTGQLVTLFSEVSKVPADRIDVQETLSSYGLDSVMIVNFNQLLAPIFGQLSKTLMYEYDTLAQLGEYLGEEYRGICVRWTGMDESADSSQPAAKPATRIERKRVAVKRLVREHDPIAIIGLAGRFPGADTIDEYWQLLCGGEDKVVEVPADRWSLQGFYEADTEQAVSQGKSYSKWGGFLDDVTSFDPLFFKISPREAHDIDPQERLFLTACWQVFEDAGYTRDSLRELHQGNVGVFVRGHQNRLQPLWPEPVGRRSGRIPQYLLQLGRQPGVLPDELPWPQHAGGYHVFIVAHRHPSSLRTSTPRRV